VFLTSTAWSSVVTSHRKQNGSDAGGRDIGRIVGRQSPPARAQRVIRAGPAGGGRAGQTRGAGVRTEHRPHRAYAFRQGVAREPFSAWSCARIWVQSIAAEPDEAQGNQATAPAARARQ
jgi:hypothetical protein